MPLRCCVSGCESDSNAVTLHRFPNQRKFPERFKAWVELVGDGSVDHKIYNSRRVCSIHFTIGEKNRYKRLNALAIPSQHLPGRSGGKPTNVSPEETKHDDNDHSVKSVPIKKIIVSDGQPNNVNKILNSLHDHNYNCKQPVILDTVDPPSTPGAATECESASPVQQIKEDQNAAIISSLEDHASEVDQPLLAQTDQDSRLDTGDVSETKEIADDDGYRCSSPENVENEPPKTGYRCSSPENVENEPPKTLPVMCVKCTQLIEKHFFVCASCSDGKYEPLCATCAEHAAENAHAACYVLRVHVTKPKSEVRGVLCAIRTELTMKSFADDLEDALSDIKSETTDIPENTDALDVDPLDEIDAAVAYSAKKDTNPSIQENQDSDNNLSDDESTAHSASVVDQFDQDLPEIIMQRARVLSVHEDTWGKATIFKPESEVTVKSETKVRESPAPTSVVSMHLLDTRSSHDRRVDEQSEQLGINLRELVSTLDLSGLSYFEASLFATVLEDTITQFRILVECNNEMRVTKTLSDYPLLRALKYGVEQPVTIDELAGIDVNNLDKLEYKLMKLDADRNYVVDLLIQMYVSLTTHGGFTVLCDYVESILDKERRFLQLIEDEARNKALAKELAKQLRRARNYHKTAQYDASVLIDTLMYAIEDADLLTETKGRYVDNWQAARTECHAKVLDGKEHIFSDSTEYYKRRTDHEQRVHSEVELLTNIIINETLQKVEEWMNKYEVDMEAIDLKIQIKRSEWQNMKDKRIYLEDTIAKHDKEIREWKQFKIDRAKAREYANNMTKSAIIVQAWWRGLLVRKQLGPYRVKKKKKK